MQDNFNPIPLNVLVPGKAVTPYRREELAQTSYRPTIVIGIGGTGLAVVRRLKKLLRQYYRENELDIFQFIVFDTTSQEVPEGEEPLDAGEFVHLGAFDAADMIRHLSENQFIARWWPGGSDQRPFIPSFSGTGANRVRAVGRLVLYNYMGSTIIPRLEDKIDRAIEINAQHGMGATSLKFYVVCSLAGGTGSGMVIDLAYAVRMLGLRRQPTAYVSGIMVMDDAFLPKAQTANTKAEFSGNTYAALREINHFSAVRSFRERYDDITSTEELPDGFRPFDVAYLLGLHNSDGQALESFESLADMIAAEMMLEIASPLHGKTVNVLDNVRANDRAIAGQPAAFSSFALSSLVYPLTGIASWCALAGLADLSEQVLLTPRKPASDVEADVNAFAQEAGVEEEQADSLIERLNHDEKGETMLTPAFSHDQVGGLPELQLLGMLQRIEEGALADLARIREAVEVNVQPIHKQFLADVHSETESTIRDPQRGPRYTAWFLSQLADRLEYYRDEHMIPEQAVYRLDAEAYESDGRSSKETLARALRLPRWMPWRRWRINGARTAYTTAFNAYLVARHELELRTQAILCFNDFIEKTRDFARKANDLVNDWIKLAESAQNHSARELTQERATETEFSLMRNIVGRDELHNTVERHFPKLDEPAMLDHIASQFWQFFDQRIPDWTLSGGSPANPVEGSPEVQLYYFLADWFASRLGDKTLVERLKEIFNQDWEHEIELCYLQTVPFWNYNLSRFGDKIRNNLQNEPRLLGYGEEDVQSWSRVVGDVIGERVDGVNNKNPHEMLFLKTSHGLPLFALRSVNQNLRTAYRYVRKLWELAEEGSNPIPVHVSMLWEQEMPDIDPKPVVIKANLPAVIPSNGDESSDKPDEVDAEDNKFLDEQEEVV